MDPIVRVENQREINAKFRGVSKTIKAQVKLANRGAAEVIADKSRTKTDTPQQDRWRSRISAGADLKSGYVRISSTKGMPGAVAAFMGTRRRTGWYAAPRYSSSPNRQFLPWVGNQHQPGDAGGIHTWGRPYAVAEAIEQTLDREVHDIYARGMRAAYERFDFEVNDTSMF